MAAPTSGDRFHSAGRLVSNWQRSTKVNSSQERDVLLCLVAFNNVFRICYPEVSLTSPLKLFPFPGCHLFENQFFHSKFCWVKLDFLDVSKIMLGFYLAIRPWEVIHFSVFLFMCMCVNMSVCLCAMYMQVPVEAREAFWFPWNWSYSCL